MLAALVSHIITFALGGSLGFLTFAIIFSAREDESYYD